MIGADGKPILTSVFVVSDSRLPGKARTGLFLRLKPGADPADLQGLHGNCPMRHLTTRAGTGSRILQNNSKRLPS